MSERTRQIEALEAELRTRGASFHVGDDFDEEREYWMREFPGETLPPRKRPPHNRDRILATAEGLRQQALHRRGAATEA